MTACEHPPEARTDGPPRPYFGPVAWPPDDEWPPAHGGHCVTVTCGRCGRRRSENRNGRHVERGHWLLPAPDPPPVHDPEALAADRARAALGAAGLSGRLVTEPAAGRTLALVVEHDGRGAVVCGAGRDVVAALRDAADRAPDLRRALAEATA